MSPVGLPQLCLFSSMEHFSGKKERSARQSLFTVDAKCGWNTSFPIDEEISWLLGHDFPFSQMIWCAGNLKATLELEKHKEIALYVLIELLCLFSLVPFSCTVIAKSCVY